MSTTATEVLSPPAMRAGVETLLTAAQRARSIAMELCDDEAFNELLSPWLFGPKSIMPTLMDLTMGAQPLTVDTYANLLSIAYRLEPSIAVWAVSVGELPELDEVWAARTLLKV